MLTNQATVKLNHEENYPEILTPGALEFLEKLHRNFNEQRLQLLKARQESQKEIINGKELQFLEETKHIREGDWTVEQIPKDLQDRRVEITGPVDRKMIINAMNSGAKAFMADFEDATSPTWENLMDGQINLRDAIRREVDFTADNGKSYALNEETAVLIVRPRGWHLDENHLTVNGEVMSGSLVDFGLYFFHNAKELLKRGSGPYFYLPKVEHHEEARLWNDVFIFAQNELGVPQGTIKATVLIETITAAFEMDEILYELRDHAAGLNCGRWDYIFSYIKKFHQNPDRILPDRAAVTMTVPFMSAYTQLAIKTCHKRNAFSMGGMAAQIPVKNDDAANQTAFEKVRADKELEARNGHDGTWVAHPGMVQLVKDIFDEIMPAPNQVDKKREDVQVTAEDLVELPEGEITEEGLRTNISVGIQYTAALLSGRGAVPINNLMEDAATAEISRAQVWQWIRYPKGVLSDGRNVTMELVEEVMKEELTKIEDQIGKEAYEKNNFPAAAKIFDDLIKEETFAEFLTLPVYEQLSKGGNK